MVEVQKTCVGGDMFGTRAHMLVKGGGHAAMHAIRCNIKSTPPVHAPLHTEFNECLFFFFLLSFFS